MKENNIKDSFQRKFHDFEVSPPANGWERLESTLERNRKIVVLRRRYISVAVAAVAILLVGSLLLMQSPQNLNNNIVQTSQGTFDKNDDIEQNELESITHVESKTQSAPQKLYAEITKKTKNNTNSTQLVNIQSESYTDNQSSGEEAKPVDVKEKHSTKNESEQEQISPAEAERRMREFVEIAEKGLVLDEVTDKSDKPILLALNARGGITPFQTTVNTPMTLRKMHGNVANSESAYFASDMATTGMQAQKNIAEMEHFLPLSLGLTFSKTIIDRLSIETGLIYTYLFSRAKNSNNLYNNEETQYFHYLGIPLLVNYNVFSIKKFNIYASLGGMLEKDIRGEFRYIESNIENNEVARSYKSTNIKQKNPQYSMSVGVGVLYPIFDKFNLYGKVGGSYYFDAKNDYKTIYSDKKIVLDLNLGIRYDLD